MRATRRRLSPEDRRSELLALGAEIFGQRPYDEVRIDEIAERAGVSRALMYHYFPDKRAFFAAVVKDEADRLFEAAHNLPDLGLSLFEEVRAAVLAYMYYHEQHPHSSWAAYVGLGRSDPVLLGIDDETKNRLMMHVMNRIVEVDGEPLDPELERDLRVVVHGWIAFTFELGRQRIMNNALDANKLADTCAHALMDAIARAPGIPPKLADAVSAEGRVLS
ncbi:TetR/AcrR family transcriptional regulator [Mycobacterium shimoidei]|uniref:TetR/AcrR family transcriptional regulator n=1 Tax=Mycobacterium shimoidei TaxID=29313 RepID=UPI0008486543|nr:TetR/AcrR family transcriptional regulator [Mycobacterium shimoidei]MCV7257940.1 TetR/AcrR family transcriptional regulator [Mycobacterium shimoidei]ODR14118.1 TetR family transcriptional regulator [Mycobacterium shimoidei]ORW83986.1 TetR family transcriptional regulator [Mycobacterium shimoidei]